VTKEDFKVIRGGFKGEILIDLAEHLPQSLEIMFLMR